MLKILRNFLLLWGLVLLQACASLGTPPIDTFNKRVVVAYTTVQTVAESATVLQRAGKLNHEENLKVRYGLQDAMAGVKAAESLSKTDLGGAQTRLTTTIQLLTVLQSFVAAKQESAK